MRPPRLGLALLLPLAACGGSISPRFDGGGGGDLAVGGGGYYAPPAYSLVPFRSASPIRVFPAAQMVLEGGEDYLAVLDTDGGRIVLDLLEGHRQ